MAQFTFVSGMNGLGLTKLAREIAGDSAILFNPEKALNTYSKEVVKFTIDHGIETVKGNVKVVLHLIQTFLVLDAEGSLLVDDMEYPIYYKVYGWLWDFLIGVGVKEPLKRLTVVGQSLDNLRFYADAAIQHGVEVEYIRLDKHRRTGDLIKTHYNSEEIESGIRHGWEIR